MTSYSNVPEPATPRALREAIDRQLLEMERISALPAGDPELLRLWGCDDKVPVPLHVFELLQPYREFEAMSEELAVFLDSLP